MCIRDSADTHKLLRARIVGNLEVTLLLYHSVFLLVLRLSLIHIWHELPRVNKGFCLQAHLRALFEGFPDDVARGDRGDGIAVSYTHLYKLPFWIITKTIYAANGIRN